MAFESESPLSTGAPNGTTGTANLISSGVWTKAALSSSSDTDYFKLIVDSAGLITLNVSNALVTATDTWRVSLLDATGDYLIQLSAPSVGTPVVSGNSNSGSSLLVSGLTSAVGIGSRFTFATTNPDTTIYTVVGATSLSGGSSTLTLDKALASAPTGSTALVFAPAQADVDGGDLILSASVAAAGTYFVEVKAANWSDAEYQLRSSFVRTVESTAENGNKVDTAEAGNRLVANAWMNGALSASIDVDTWVFTTAAVASDLYIDFSAASGDNNAPEWDIKLATWSGDQPLTTVQGTALSGSVGKSGTYEIDNARYTTATTFVVTVSAKSGVTFDPGSYQLRLRGDSVDLNDTPVITVDTRDSGAPNEYIPTGIVRSLKASSDGATSKVALKSLFSVSDADVTAATQTIKEYIVGLGAATDSTATGSIRIITDSGETAYVNGAVMSAADMANAYLVAGATLGDLNLVIQAFDSSNAADGSGASSLSHQTVRLVSEGPSVTVKTDGTLLLLEGATILETGYSETLSFKLASAPTQNVLVYLEQSTPNQLGVSKSLLTFTPDDYAIEQTVTVTATADTLTENSHTGQLSFRVVSEDTTYNNLAVSSQTFALSDPVSNHLPQGAVTLVGVARIGEEFTANNTLTDTDGLGELSYRWERSQGSEWITIDNATTSKYLATSTDLGAKLRVTVSYVDGLNNAESVSSAESSAVLAAGGYNLSGGARFWKNPTIKLSDVAVTGGGQSATADATGAFALTALTQEPADDVFVLSASKTVTATRAADAGINLTDVLATLKVYLGKELPAAYKSDFNYIAADFDANGTVNLTDVLSLLKYYLGKPSTVAPTWAFVDSADILANGTITVRGVGGISKSASLPDALDVDVSANDVVELVGVLRGDVDGSWTPS